MNPIEITMLTCFFFLGSYEIVLKQSHSTFPDYMLVFAIAILAHCPQFTDPKNVDQLLTMKSCLWFIMEPLITKNDSYCYSFYKGMLDRLKTVKDALEPDNEVVNEVSITFFLFFTFVSF